MTDDTLTFDATVNKVQTLADHGLRVTLDLPEHEILSVAMLMTYKRGAVALRVSVQAMPVKQTRTEDDASIPKRPKRKSQWTPTEKQGAH